MQPMKMSISSKTAVGGLTAALACAVMFCINLIPTVQYTLPAIAGGIIYCSSFVLGKRWAFYSYIVCGVISFFICSEKASFISYALIFGYYPLLSPEIRKIRSLPFRMILKLMYINAVAAAYYYIALLVFNIKVNMTIFGAELSVVFLILVNIAFFVYDRFILIFTRRYRLFIEKMIHSVFKR